MKNGFTGKTWVALGGVLITMVPALMFGATPPPPPPPTPMPAPVVVPAPAAAPAPAVRPAPVVRPAPNAAPVPVVRPAPTMAPAAMPVSPTATADAPKIKFDNTVLDFGNVKPTDLVTHNFIFTNIGKSTLEITGVRPACGCTTAGDWAKTVAPGETGAIPIQFNPGTFSGQVAKSVTVTCNDPFQPTVYLQIKGTVWKPIDVDPRYAYFTVSEGSETNQTKVIKIKNNTEEPLTVSEPQWDNPSFKAELKTITPGKEFEMHVTLVPPVETSRSVTPIKLNTSSTNMPVVTISAYAMVQSSVQIMPQRLTLPYGPMASGSVYSVTIRNVGARPMKLTEPGVNIPGATVKLEEPLPGKQFKLNIVFPNGFEAEANQTFVLSVKSDSPNMPVIRVPIVQPTVAAPAIRPAIVPAPAARAAAAAGR